jgi:polysaccharide export outer membrane protein
MKGILGLNRLSFRSCAVLSFVVVVASCVPQRRLTYLAPLPKGTEVQEATMAVYPDYRFQPNDIINVQVKTLNPEIDQFYNTMSMQNGGGMMMGTPAMAFMMGYPIDQRGEVRIPGIGQVRVVSLTAQEAQDTISKVLLKQFVEGTVFVKVQLAGIRYTVVGECFRPGVHYLYQNQATLLDALANAGDITMLGDRKRVQVTRLSDGKWKTFVVDLTQRETLNRPEFILQPNDLIQVRPLPQKSSGVGQTGFGTFSSLVGVLSSSIALYLALTR